MEGALDEIEQEEKACQTVRELVTFMGAQERNNEGTDLELDHSEKERAISTKSKENYRKAQSDKVKVTDLKLDSAVQTPTPANIHVPEVTLWRKFWISYQIGEGGLRDTLIHKSVTSDWCRPPQRASRVQNRGSH